MEAARRAQPAWAALPAPARGEILLRAAGLLADRRETVATDLVREEGKTFAEAYGEVGRAIELLQFYGGEGRRGRAETPPSGTPHTHIHTRREPLGSVGVITPWNFPIAIPTWKTSPALISGNTVVLKPAGLTPLSTWHLAEVLADAGLPPGVLNIVYGPGARSAGPSPGIRAWPRCRSPAPTTSAAASSGSRRSAARASCWRWAARTRWSSWTTPTRSPPRDRFVAALAEQAARYRPGDGLDRSVLMGPVVSAAQMRGDLEWLRIAEEEGTQAVVKGEQSGEAGQFLEPTVLVGVRRDHRVAREEIFGPVVGVLAADDPDHAVGLADDIPFGLSAGIVTNDPREAQRFVERVQAGIVKVNRPTSGVDPNLPFGGVKESSTNTYPEQGASATDFYTWTKSVYLGWDDEDGEG